MRKVTQISLTSAVALGWASTSFADTGQQFNPGIFGPSASHVAATDTETLFNVDGAVLTAILTHQGSAAVQTMEETATLQLRSSPGGALPFIGSDAVDAHLAGILTEGGNNGVLEVTSTREPRDVALMSVGEEHQKIARVRDERSFSVASAEDDNPEAGYTRLEAGADYGEVGVDPRYGDLATMTCVGGDIPDHPATFAALNLNVDHQMAVDLESADVPGVIAAGAFGRHDIHRAAG